MSHGSKCPSCGEYEGRHYCTFLPDPDNPGEWEWITICMSCDHGVEVEDLLWYRYRLVSTITSYGLGKPDIDGDSLIVDEFSIESDPEGGFLVAGWTGFYPFAEGTELGAFSTIEDACRYMAWLIKREALQIERDKR